MSAPPARTMAAIAIFVLALILPRFCDDFQLSVLALVFLFAAVGQAWNLMMGFSGQLSLGHSLFFGSGAYAMAILVQKFQVSPWLGMIAAFIVGAVTGGLTGALGFRFAVRGIYFALLTIAFAELARLLVEHWSFVGATGGLFYSALKPDNQPLLSLRGGATFFYYALLVTLVAFTAICAALVHSKVGFYWRAIREDEDAARALGVPAFRLKVMVTAISAGLTGIAGAWFGLLQGSLFPETVLGMRMSIEIIIAPIVGGLGTLVGPFVGAAVLVPLSEFSRDLAQHYSINGLNLVLYGALLMAIIVFAPIGLWPVLTRQFALWRAR